MKLWQVRRRIAKARMAYTNKGGAYLTSCPACPGAAIIGPYGLRCLRCLQVPIPDCGCADDSLVPPASVSVPEAIGDTVA